MSATDMNLDPTQSLNSLIEEALLNFSRVWCGVQLPKEEYVEFAEELIGIFHQHNLSVLRQTPANSFGGAANIVARAINKAMLPSDMSDPGSLADAALAALALYLNDIEPTSVQPFDMDNSK